MSTELSARRGRSGDPGARRGRSQGGRSPDGGAFNHRTRYRRALGKVFATLFLMATLTGIITLAALLLGVWRDGAGSLSVAFLTSFPSRFASQAGILPALVGSLWIMTLTLIIAFPLGVGTAIWLEEYAPRGRVLSVVQTNIANLAGVPSVVYGILGLALFVRALALGFVPFIPSGPGDGFTVLPVQIYNWISRPQPEFHALAAAGILVLLAVLLILNAAAIILRNRYTTRL